MGLDRAEMSMRLVTPSCSCLMLPVYVEKIERKREREAASQDLRDYQTYSYEGAHIS